MSGRFAIARSIVPLCAASWSASFEASSSAMVMLGKRRWNVSISSGMIARPRVAAMPMRRTPFWSAEMAQRSWRMASMLCCTSRAYRRKVCPA